MAEAEALPEKNTLNLIMTSLPAQFIDIHSPDRLSGYDIVSGILKVIIPSGEGLSLSEMAIMNL